MSDIDRDDLLHHLSDLAAEDDAVVLAAARAANAMVTDGGLTWSDVLAPPPDDHDHDADIDLDDDDDDDGEDEIAVELDDDGDGDDLDADPAPDDDEPDYPADAKISEADAAEARSIIGSLLARKNLFDATRDELKDYQQDLKDGDLHPADVSYLRALNKRLSKK